MAGRVWIAAGALLAALAVTAGAMGAHVLKEKLKLPQPDLDSYDLAVRYQMYHALGLILVGILAARGPNRLVSAAGAAFALGIVLFSGGIYVRLATPYASIVHVVPIGGATWIVGWLLLAAGALAGRPCSDHARRA